jgi:sialate O-acetylesterase
MQMSLARQSGYWMRILIAFFVIAGGDAFADVTLPNVFGSHMVLQQGQKNKVWGHANAGETVIVKIDSQSHQTTADADGKWHVMLDPLIVGGPFKMLVNGKNEIVFDDVLVGEVWVCSGQSNMQWSVKDSTDPDLERSAAIFPKIRMINFPQIGSQEPTWTHDRQWKICSPQSVGDFSAVGYFFARQLHQTLGVPIGMVNNAWGGSSCEGWIRRDLLAADDKYKRLMDYWSAEEASFLSLSKKTDLVVGEKEKLDGLRKRMQGSARPGNIYNGVLKSHMGYGIRGAIWYQGESNVKRSYQYRDLFPQMIQSWRQEWGQGDFPFYWVQLADYMAEKAEPAESLWAELREAQTMTMKQLPGTGEAVIIDLGEAKDIHPKNKVDVGRRLARWALANDYGIPEIEFRSPIYKSSEKHAGKMVLAFENVTGGWRPFDVAEPRGFAIAGTDKKFVWANAKILPDGRIEVESDLVKDPAAVRYAWSDNPVCNMFSEAGLPLTPFRTDTWPGLSFGKVINAD